MATAATTSTVRRRGRPPKVPYPLREERILDAATAAFAEHGRSSVSVEAIAEAAGINKALVYEHFGSKDELFAAVVRRARDAFVGFVAGRLGDSRGQGTRARIRAQFHAFVDFAETHPAPTALLGLPEAAAILDGTGRGALADTLAGQLRREFGDAGLPTQEVPTILAAMFVGMAGSVIRTGAGRHWDREAVVDLLTEFTLGGMASIDRLLLERVDRPATER